MSIVNNNINSGVAMKKGGKVMEKRNEMIKSLAMVKEFMAIQPVRDKVEYVVMDSEQAVFSKEETVQISWPEYLINMKGGKLVRFSGFANSRDIAPVIALKDHMKSMGLLPSLGSASMTRGSDFFGFSGMDHEELYSIAAMGAKFYGEEVNINKASARIFANFSVGTVVGFGYRAENAEEAKKVAEEAGVAESPSVQIVVVKDYCVRKPNGDVVIAGDGQIHANSEFSYMVQAALGLRHVPTAVQLRAGGAKGLAIRLPKSVIKKILKDNGISLQDVDINKPLLLVPLASWKFSPEWELFPISVLRTSEVAHPDRDVTRTTYQLIQNLVDGEWLKKKAEQTADFFLTWDPVRILEALSLKEEDSEDASSGAVDDSKEKKGDGFDITEVMKVAKVIKANPEGALAIPAVRQKIATIFETKVKEIIRGRLVVSGNFSFMAVDPSFFLNKVEKEVKEGLLLATDLCELKEGEIASAYTGKVVVGRFPMAMPSEPKRLVSKNKILGFKVTENVCYFNVFGAIWEGMNGADFDGDICIIIQDDDIYANVRSWSEAPDVPKKEGAKSKFDIKGIWDAIKANMVVPGAKINVDGKEVDALVVGQVALYIAGIMAQYNATKNVTPDSYIYYLDDNMKLQKSNVTFKAALEELYAVQNYVIDYAKTGYMPEISDDLKKVLMGGRPSYTLHIANNAYDQFHFALEMARKVAAKGKGLVVELKDDAAQQHYDKKNIFAFAYNSEFCKLPLVVAEKLAKYKEADLTHSGIIVDDSDAQAEKKTLVAFYDDYKKAIRALKAKGGAFDIGSIIEKFSNLIAAYAVGREDKVAKAAINLAAGNEGLGKFLINCAADILAAGLATADNRVVLTKKKFVKPVAGKAVETTDAITRETVVLYGCQYHKEGVADLLAGNAETISFKRGADYKKAFYVAYCNGKSAGIVNVEKFGVEQFGSTFGDCEFKVVNTTVKDEDDGVVKSVYVTFETVAVSKTEEFAAPAEVATDSTGVLEINLAGSKRDQIIAAGQVADYLELSGSMVKFSTDNKDVLSILAAAKANNTKGVHKIQHDPEYYNAFMALVNNRTRFVVR